MNTKNLAEEYPISTKPFEELVGTDVLGLIFRHAPTKVRSRVQKALDHLGKAERLVGVDEEMGAIRCIAAEEELVVALFEWLKLNTDKVSRHSDFIRKYRNHPVKLSFYPVLSQFRFVLQDMLRQGITIEGLEDVLKWNVTAECRDDQVQLIISDQRGQELLKFNPLALAVEWNDRPHQEVIDAMFNDFAALVLKQRGMNVRDFVMARADYRNRLLYAEDGGSVIMDDNLEALLDLVFKPSLRDLLWCLAVLLTNDPVHRDWGLVSQFIWLYRRVLAEAKLIEAPSC